MIYEMRTYELTAGSVAEFEEKFVEALSHREKYSKLGAFWHTEFGPLNQVIHIWPYEDLNERTKVRAEAVKDPNWPPKTGHLVLNMESEIMIPAPFMRPLGNQQLGNIYEMRVYTYQPNTIPEVINRWAEAIPHREKLSPLAACWYSELGGLKPVVPHMAIQRHGGARADPWRGLQGPPLASPDPRVRGEPGEQAADPRSVLTHEVRIWGHGPVEA